MLTERSGKQNKLELVILEDFVPQDHLLRQIDKAIDFSFINKICKPYYCENNGRPAIEPEVLFRMLFIGYLYGIRSEIRLLKEIEVNVAYRWFIGYDLTEKLPDVSVIWKNRLRRYFYLDHRTVDSKHNIITDVFVTPGNTNDVKPYLGRLRTQIEKFGFAVKYVGLDAGYNVSTICKYLYEMGIQAAMGNRRGCQQKGIYGKYKFHYLPEWDVYICPEHKYLEYVTTDRNGYKEYKCKCNRCANCPKQEECLSAKQERKSLRRHVWEENCNPVLKEFLQIYSSFSAF